MGFVGLIFLVKEIGSDILSIFPRDIPVLEYRIEPKSTGVPSLDQAFSITLEEGKPSHGSYRVIMRVFLSYLTTN